MRIRRFDQLLKKSSTVLFDRMAFLDEVTVIVFIIVGPNPVGYQPIVNARLHRRQTNLRNCSF
ncbi:hypothetical protein DSM3645_02883 [Blastopirellula marina DSM 3645]|uniref:Uncharacterized protein n=1 Tax=Blastopirellula marina DSM 3645 TaxID=314230 RepID=A3ZVP0_9BACT|nr:hypothetical protein DSM3645_02883 [Blastopirellula marina DSM 3645]